MGFKEKCLIKTEIYSSVKQQTNKTNKENKW